MVVISGIFVALAGMGLILDRFDEAILVTLMGIYFLILGRSE